MTMDGIKHTDHSGIITISPLPGISMCPFCAFHIVYKRIKLLRGGRYGQ